MTRPAWIMMLVTWAVIIFFAVRFFWLVYRIRDEDGSSGGDDHSGPESPIHDDVLRATQ